MSITATNSGGGDFTPVPAGTYAARCFSMIQIGTVPEVFNGETKMMNKVRITFELPTELKEFKEGEGEKPLTISKEFTLSMSEKANLRKFLEGWRGKGFSEADAEKFDITKLLGISCLISVIHKTSKKGKVYADISSASVLPKGMTVPDQINTNFEFTFEDFSQDKFNKLPEFLRKKIQESEEYKKATDPAHTEAISDNDNAPIDDLPF